MHNDHFQMPICHRRYLCTTPTYLRFYYARLYAALQRSQHPTLPMPTGDLTSTGQSKRSRMSSPLRSSINSKGIRSCSFLWKQTVICLTSDLSLSWCHSFPPHTRSSFLISPLVASPWKEKWWRKEVKRRWRRLEGFSKSAQASPIGLTSSFFPFPSLPPLSLCLSLFILHFFFHCYPFSFPCSRTLGCIADSCDVVVHKKE